MKDSAKGGIFRVPEKIHPTGPAVLRDRTKRIVFLSGTRTPFGRVGGSLSRFSPIDLGAKAARAAIEQAGLTDGVNVIDAAIFGNGMHTSIDAHYGARHVGLKAGLSHFSTALTVNRICWSGGEAIVTGAKELLAGEAEVVLAGGYESTSQSPMVVYGAAFGFPYMSGPEARFLFKDGLNDTFINADMMETAENLARLYGITRKDADECAYESQLKASDAKVNGRLAREITPLTLTERRAERIFGEDENPRSDTTVEGLSRLRSVKPDGIHTAGNSSGIVDGAAALVMTTYGKAKELGAEPIGELLSWGTAGVDPHYMGIGPVPASAIALERAGLAWKDMKHIEINEAFAGQYLAVERELNLDRSKVNINGGAIALGHPLGATGARLTISLLRLGGLGLAAACIGGGQGGALIVEGY
ncbi:MAG TPA: acetyl-CoA C-acyltransferase [Bacteroidetes bacterium]|nr:acetyl-CoA C-acyltransferase [Bacteroidota bacterium]